MEKQCARCVGDPNRQGDERRRTPRVVTSAHTPTPTASRATATDGQKEQKRVEKITRHGCADRGAPRALPRRARVAGEDAIEIREIRHRFAAMHADDADDAEGREKKQKKRLTRRSRKRGVA